jgi:hypothetical protein
MGAIGVMGCGDAEPCVAVAAGAFTETPGRRLVAALI